MEKVHKLIPSEFSVNITNTYGNGDFVTDVALQSIAVNEDYKEYAAGTVEYEGYTYNLGNSLNKTETVKSVGGLVVLDAYAQKGDDYLGMYFPEVKGKVVLDKDLNVIYKNFYNSKTVFYNKEDAYKLLHDFGPEALAFLEPKQFGKETQQDVQRIFDLRIKKQEENFISAEKIEKEKELFEKVFKACKSEYEQTKCNECER